MKKALCMTATAMCLAFCWACEDKAAGQAGAGEDTGEALFWATAEGDLKKVKELVAAGVDLNAANRFGKTALHRAAFTGNAEIVTLLLEHGADPDILDHTGYSPLHEAALEGKAAVLALLCSAGADKNIAGASGRTPLHELARLHTESPASGSISLLNAARNLLGEGADPGKKDGEGMTPLHWAAKTGYTELVELLIEEGADVNAKDLEGQMPLDLALRYPAGPEAALELTQWKAETAARPANIPQAVLLWDVNILNLLISQGRDVNERDRFGMPALYYALKRLNVFQADVLLAAGADPDTKIQGSPVLCLAAAQGECAFVELLLTYGAAVNATDGKGRTPLDFARDWGVRDKLIEREALSGKDLEEEEDN